MTEASAISTLSVHNGIAVLKIDSPPVNALGHKVRIALIEGVTQALADPQAQALVLICGGRTFFAGADIRELGKPILPPLLRDIMDSLDSSAKPTVAAIHGTALGGGFELALACHYRIAATSAQVGLPEAALGLLPGAGGTQRAPRLIGVAAAVDMIVFGKSYRAKAACDVGLIDAVVEDSKLETAAIAYAADLVSRNAPLRRTRDLTADMDAAAAAKHFAAFRSQHPELFRHLKAPENVLKAIQAAVELPFDEGLRREAELSKELVASPESAAQRYLFFAERTAATVPDLDKQNRPKPVKSVMVLGDGEDARALQRVIQRTGLTLVSDISAQGGAPDLVFDFLTGHEASAQRSRIAPTIDAETIIVGKASLDDISALTEAYGHPVRVLGASFRRAADEEPVMEIMRGQQTSAEATAAVIALTRALKKVAVISGAGHQTILQRLMAVAQEAAQGLAAEGVPYAAMNAALADMGFLENWLPSPASEPAGRSTLPASAILERLLVPIAQEGARLVEAGIALRTSDVDTALVKSAGWPVHTGGPIFWASANSFLKS